MTWLHTFARTRRRDKSQEKWILLAWGVLASWLAAMFFRNTVGQGQDFEVFWKTANFVGTMLGPVYHPGRDGAASFKYPPWTVPLFMPLALLSLQAAKLFWAALQCACLAYVVGALHKTGFRLGTLLVVTIAWSGIWIVHSLDGQVTLVVLALALWSFPRNGWVPMAVHLFALSMKGPSIFGSIPKALELRRRPLWVLALVLAAWILSIPSFWSHDSWSLFQMIQNWIATGQSGEHWLGRGSILGRPNQGFPALLRRVWPGTSELMWCLVLFPVLGWIWFKVAAKVTSIEKWFGYLALSVVTHPLAWFHSYVLVFPLGVVAAQRWDRSGTWMRVMLLVGLLGIGSVTEKTFGSAGLALEMGSIKAWSTLLLLIVIAAVPSEKSGAQAKLT